MLVCASAGPYIVCTGRGIAVIPISGGTAQAYRPRAGQRYRAAMATGETRTSPPRNPIRAAGRRCPGLAQFVIVFLVWFVVFWVGHVHAAQPADVPRGFLYGIFWGVPFALLTLLATRSEQTKRYLREHPEEHDAH